MAANPAKTAKKTAKPAPAKGPPTLAVLGTIIRGLWDADPARGRVPVSPRRLRDHMLAARDRLAMDRDGAARAYAELSRMDAFAAEAPALVRKRFPALQAVLRPGNVVAWSVSVRHEAEPDGVRIEERRLPSGPLVAALVAMAEAGTAEPGALAPLVEAETRRIADEAAPVLRSWSQRLGSVLRHVDEPEAFSDRLRQALRDRVVDRRLRPAETLEAVLKAAFDATAAEVEDDLSHRRFRAVVGYADRVERLRASRLPRRVVFHAGPTNSGKTHAAMEALGAAGDGCYLAPLRLLALEGYERLRGAVPRAGMVTGEETIDEEGAIHLAMTVEMADLARRWDVAVIDEIQMLQDPERGWAWTRALFGVRCGTLHLCGSPDALPLVERAASLLGEEVEVVRYARKTPLHVGAANVRLGGVRPGDALIAFSRRQVMYYRERLLQRGVAVAAVYGSLSPEVRRAEAARFRSGEAQVLIATDSIGMGLNLGPLRRVVFTELEKFDGRARRRLIPSEIRQIAGRAGRFGHHEAGYVATMTPDTGPVRAALSGRPDPGAPDGLFLARPEPGDLAGAAAELGSDSLVAVLRAFERRSTYAGSQYKPGAMGTIVEMARLVDALPLPVAEKYAFATCPVDRRKADQREALLRFARARATGIMMMAPPAGPAREGPGLALEADEGEVRLMTVYLWLARRFPDTFIDAAGATARREAANARVEAALASSALTWARRDESRAAAGWP